MIMQSIGVKELKNRLTHYLKLVRNGDQVIVTERGNPIAILHGLEKVDLTDSAEEKRLRHGAWFGCRSSGRPCPGSRL
jgi:prevent-host-death family protein